MPDFYCCTHITKNAQPYITYINPRNKQTYQYGQCRHCRKRFLIQDGEEITGRRAKQIWGLIKHKLRQDTSKYDKYRKKTVLKDYFTFAVSARRRIKGRLIHYQIEKRLISGYSTGRSTLKKVLGLITNPKVDIT